MASFTIKLHEIDDDGKDFSFPIDRPWLTQALAGTELGVPDSFDEGRVEGRAQKSGADVLVLGTVKQRVSMTCGRCLSEVPLEVAVDLATLFSRRAPTPEEGEIELSDEDVQHESFSSDRVELDGIVREMILLETPMQPLCAENCPGIEVPDSVRGSASGATAEDGRVIDPRLAPLLNFKKR